MAYKVVMKSSEMVELVKHICFDLPTDYNNKYPYNCGYHHPSNWTWDCWNYYPKTLVWGWSESIPAGSYQKANPSTGLGDWNGWTILNCCSQISKSFVKVIPAEFLLYSDKSHAGCYVGEFAKNGNTYNVIECTSNKCIGKGVKPSWVDSDGTRRACRGGTISGSWGWHGQLPWVDYSEKPVDVLAIDGSWGMATTRYTQKMLGTTIDGKVSNQPRSNKKYLPNASTNSWEFKLLGYKAGSNMIRALQKLIGAEEDGFFGKNSVMALQRFLNSYGYDCGAVDGSMGANTVKAWQRFVNAYFSK